MSGGNTAEEWLDFFLDAGVDESAKAYAISFANNHMKLDMLSELKKEYLQEMGITRIGHIIAILRHAKTVHERSLTTSILPSIQKEEKKEKPKVTEDVISQRASVKSSTAARVIAHYMPKISPPCTRESEPVSRKRLKVEVASPSRSVSSLAAKSSTTGGGDPGQKQVSPSLVSVPKLDESNGEEDSITHYADLQNKASMSPQEEERTLSIVAGTQTATVGGIASRLGPTISSKMGLTNSVFSRLGSKTSPPSFCATVPAAFEGHTSPNTSSILRSRSRALQPVNSPNVQGKMSVGPSTSQKKESEFSVTPHSTPLSLSERLLQFQSKSQANTTTNGPIIKTSLLVQTSNQEKAKPGILKRRIPPTKPVGVSNSNSILVTNKKAVPAHQFKTMHADQPEVPVRARTKLPTFTTDNMSSSNAGHVLRKSSIKDRLGFHSSVRNGGQHLHSPSASSMEKTTAPIFQGKIETDGGGDAGRPVKRVSFGSVTRQMIPGRPNKPEMSNLQGSVGQNGPVFPDQYKFLGSIGLGTGVFSRLGKTSGE